MDRGTKEPLAAWGHVLHDPDLAEAVLDRVLERGRHPGTILTSAAQRRMTEGSATPSGRSHLNNVRCRRRSAGGIAYLVVNGMSVFPLDFELAMDGEASRRFRELGVTRFAEASKLVEGLTYGRPSSAGSSMAVLDEERGTCSSKHVLLARLAAEAGRVDVEVVLGYIEMTESNSPGIGVILQRHSLDAIPEVHCYLRVGAERVDVTGLPRARSPLVSGVIREEVVELQELHAEKLRRHKAYLSEWCEARGLDRGAVWAAREEWIAALSARSEGRRRDSGPEASRTQSLQ